MLSQLVAAFVAADERAWKTRPILMIALMAGFVVVGVTLIVTQLSVAAGNAFLLSFLTEMAFVALRFRGKPVEQEETQ
jgi:hypothetical protein